MRNRVVRFAIGGVRRARGTAEAKCVMMLRIADRPAAHAGPQLHKLDGNSDRSRMRFPIVYHVWCGLPTAAESTIAYRSFSRLLVFLHLKSIETFLNYLSTIALFSGLDADDPNPLRLWRARRDAELPHLRMSGWIAFCQLLGDRPIISTVRPMASRR